MLPLAGGDFLDVEKSRPCGIVARKNPALTMQKSKPQVCVCRMSQISFAAVTAVKPHSVCVYLCTLYPQFRFG